MIEDDRFGYLLLIATEYLFLVLTAVLVWCIYAAVNIELGILAALVAAVTALGYLLARREKKWLREQMNGYQ